MKPILLFYVLFSCTLFYGCASTESTSERAETEEIPVEGIQIPDWYSDGILGESDGSVVVGYARAVSGDADHALANAVTQAGVNLRYWIDARLEEARQELSEVDQDATGRDFIIGLRNAVDDLDIDESGYISDTYVEQSAAHAFVRIEIPESDVMEYLEQEMAPWESTWRLMAGRDLLVNR